MTNKTDNLSDDQKLMLNIIHNMTDGGKKSVKTKNITNEFIKQKLRIYGGLQK